MISSYNPGIVALFAQANAPFSRNLINKYNFVVNSVEKTTDPLLNTRAEITADRTINESGGTISLPEGETQFFNRSVQFHRFDLTKEVLPLLVDGSGNVDIADWDNSVTDQNDLTGAFIAGVASKVSFTTDDIYLVPTPTAGTYVLVAKPDSLGFVGRATITIVLLTNPDLGGDEGDTSVVIATAGATPLVVLRNDNTDASIGNFTVTIDGVVHNIDKSLTLQQIPALTALCNIYAGSASQLDIQLKATGTHKFIFAPSTAQAALSPNISSVDTNPTAQQIGDDFYFCLTKSPS